MPRQIALSRGLYALVDEIDAERVSAYTWYAKRHKKSFYPARNADGGTQYLHQFLLGKQPGTLIDHINGDPLDCRRANLRRCTSAQNAQNRAKSKGKSPLKGVIPRKTGFTAVIRTGGIRHNLGFFATEADAARAYDAAARRLFGDFAKPNYAG